MKTTIAKRWVAALRSGKYKQGKGVLRMNDAFCCLGVLCDISHKHRWRKQYRYERDVGRRYGREDSALPKTVQKWAGMRSANGDFNIESLANLNDDGVPFTEIADIIEKHVKDL